MLRAILIALLAAVIVYAVLAAIGVGFASVAALIVFLLVLLAYVGPDLTSRRRL